MSDAIGLKNAVGQPLRVLVVEDETMVALVVRDALEEMGCDVIGWANTAPEAHRIAAACPPDLVLMDIRLKGTVDGVATAAELRRYYNAPVVFVTGFAEEQQLAEASHLSPVPVLRKPFLQLDLARALQGAMDAPQTAA